MTRALELNKEPRLHPLGLSKADILDYLPVTAFVADAASWGQLRQELAKSTGKDPSGNDFKKWLKSAKKADLSDAAIERAAASSDYVPEDFTQLLNHLDNALRL